MKSIMINTDYSPLMKSMINPFDNIAHYNDFDQTSCIIKSIGLNYNLKPPVDDILLIHRPLHPDNKKILQLYAKDPAFNGYTYVMDVEPDEDLSQNFDRARLVTAGLKVFGNTVAPSNTFTISGSINAADVQTTPIIRELDYQQIPSYKRNNRDVVMNEMLMNGIVSLHHLEGQNRYRILESNSSENTDSFLRFGLNADSDAELIAQGFNITALPAYSWSVVNGRLPGNMEGYITIDAYWRTENAAIQDWYFDVIQRKLDPTDMTTVIPVTTTIYISGNTTGAVHLRHKFYVDSPIEEINTYVVPVDTAVTTAFRLSFECENYYQLGYVSPATLIGIQGFAPHVTGQPGQTISLSGKYNYETVPDAQLARQMNTDAPRVEENPLILMQILNIISAGYIKFLYPLKDYRLFIGQHQHSISSVEKITNAAGLGSLLKNVLKGALPMLSDVAQTIVPGTGQLVRTIGGALLDNSAGIIPYNRYNSAGVVPYNSAGIVPFKKSSNAAGIITIDNPCELESEVAEKRESNCSMLGAEEWETDKRQINYKVTETRVQVNAELGDVPVYAPDPSTKKLLCAGEYVNALILGLQAGQWRNVSTFWNGALFPYIRGEVPYIGAVVTTTQNFHGEWNEYNLEYQVPNGGPSILVVRSDFLLDEDALIAIMMAHSASNTPMKIAYVIRDYSDKDDTLSGGSLGIATWVAFMNKTTYALFTGAISYDLTFYTPAALPIKLNTAYKKGFPLIVAGDEDEVLQQLDSETVTTTNDISFGDVNAYGIIKPVWNVINIPALTLACIYCLSGLTKGRIGATTPIVSVEEYLATNPTTNIEYASSKTIIDEGSVPQYIEDFWEETLPFFRIKHRNGQFNIDPDRLSDRQKITMYSSAYDNLVSYENKREEGVEKLVQNYPSLFDGPDSVIAYIENNWENFKNNQAMNTAAAPYEPEDVPYIYGYLTGALSNYLAATTRTVKGPKRPVLGGRVLGTFKTLTQPPRGPPKKEQTSKVFFGVPTKTREVKPEKAQKVLSQPGKVGKPTASELFGEPETFESIKAPPAPPKVKKTSAPKVWKRKEEEFPPLPQPTGQPLPTITYPEVTLPTIEITSGTQQDPTAMLLQMMQGIATNMQTLTADVTKLKKGARGGVSGLQKNAAGEPAQPADNN